MCVSCSAGPVTFLGKKYMRWKGGIINSRQTIYCRPNIKLIFRSSRLFLPRFCFKTGGMPDLKQNLVFKSTFENCVKWGYYLFKSTHKIKKFVSLLSVIFIFSANVPQASARSLGVGNRTQAKSNWCWVACAEMIGRYYGYTNSQSEICRRTIGNTDNEIATVYTASRAIQIAANE